MFSFTEKKSMPSPSSLMNPFRNQAAIQSQFSENWEKWKIFPPPPILWSSRIFYLLFPRCHSPDANFTINGKIWKILKNSFDALIFSNVFAFLLPLFSLSWLRTSPRVFSSKPAGDFFSSEEESGADYKIIRWIATQLITSNRFYIQACSIYFLIKQICSIYRSRK